MKVGDILVCKEDYIINGTKTHTKGNKYEILDVGYMIDITTNNTDEKYGLNFSINGKTHFHLFDYFYTKEELRNLKLKSL